MIAYEFIAEPVISDDNGSRRPPNWNDFFIRTVKTIRKTSNKYILYTPGPWGGPNGYVDMGSKFKDNRIIYNFHFYRPHKYTHQGVGNRSNEYTYPSKIKWTYWDKNKLEEQVDIVAAWAQKNKVHYLFVGEFSVVRWADGKERYLTDLLSIFEKNNISWAYFSFNGWKGWNFNLEPAFKQKGNKDPYLKKERNTKTKQILETYWSKNHQTKEP